MEKFITFLFIALFASIMFAGCTVKEEAVAENDGFVKGIVTEKIIVEDIIVEEIIVEDIITETIID